MSRRGVVGVVLAVSALLAGCGGSTPSTPRVLQWWVVPDRVGASAIADACSAEADDYTIKIEHLPPGIDRRRTEIVRRLAAGDDSIDILSLDTSLVAEVAAADDLAPVPADVEPKLSKGMLPKAVDAASVGDRLVVAPWWLDPQVLWYRGTVAERAGIDITKPVNWDDLLAGAERLGTTLELEDPDGNGLSDWVRALVAGAGGTLVEGSGRSPKVGLSSDAGRLAAGIVQFYAGAGIGPGPSTDALTEFAGARGGFLLASPAVVGDPVLATVVPDMKAVPYPVVDGDSVAPLSGVSLAVPADAPDPKVAYQAVECLTSESSQKQMMIGSGHGATREAVYKSDDVTKALPASDIALKAVSTGVNVPSTPYWQRVRAALRDTWMPLSSVSPSTTPAESAQAVTDLVAGGLR